MIQLAWFDLVAVGVINVGVFCFVCNRLWRSVNFILAVLAPVWLIVFSMIFMIIIFNTGETGQPIPMKNLIVNERMTLVQQYNEFALVKKDEDQRVVFGLPTLAPGTNFILFKDERGERVVKILLPPPAAKQ